MKEADIQEGDYDCELVVIADGWKLRLVDPYGTAPRLYVRRPGAIEEGPSDPFLGLQADIVVKTVFTNVCRQSRMALTNRTTAIIPNCKL